MPFRTPTREFQYFFETSNGCLPLAHGSDRRETSAKRVSDDLQISIFFRRKFFFEQFFVFFFGFSLFSVDFRGARLFLTSESSSSRFFALDGQVFRSVRPLQLIFRFFTVRTSSCGGKARVTEIPGGRSPPDPPWGQGTRNGDSWGGKPPQTPPRHHFKKFALQGQIF